MPKLIEKTGNKRNVYKSAVTVDFAITLELNIFTEMSNTLITVLATIPSSRLTITSIANPVDGFLKTYDVQYASGIEAKPKRKSINNKPTAVFYWPKNVFS